MRKISCSLIYEGYILAKVGGFSLKMWHHLIYINFHLVCDKKSNNEMPITYSNTQGGFNKKNCRPYYLYLFLVVVIYIEEMH